MAERSRAALPYLIVLGIAIALWFYADASITYDARSGQLGPTFWPKLALGVMMLACLYEIGRIALSATPGSEAGGLTEMFDRSEEEDKAEEDIPRYPKLLFAGAALTLGYAVFVTTLGFVLSNFLFLVLFMYIGGYRNHPVIWFWSVVGTLAFAFVFLRFAYVSVPRGTAPFDAVTQAVMRLLGGS